MQFSWTRRAGLAATASLLLSAVFAGPALADPVTITLLIDNGSQTVPVVKKLVEDFEAKNPDIKIDVDTRPGGTEGDNIIKTRLATGDMADVFLYNSGSLFQATNPQQNLLDLTDEPYQSDLTDVFKQVVSVDGHVYGVPFQTAMGGGVLYNKKVYADLKLSVPKSWSEFMANSEKIKAAGKTAVIQTFKDTWSSQLFVLGDFYNVQAAEPDFAAKYTANQAKFATSPAAVKGFQHQQDVFKAGYLNADFGAASYDDGLKMLATGAGVQYPMLTFAIAALKSSYPDQLKDIGFFALPGDDAARNGLTVWMPAAFYINKQTDHAEEAKKFLAFVASPAGCDSQTAAVGVTGPYLLKSCKLPSDVPPAVADLLPYFQDGGHASPALEFVSPVKGPSLEQITVEVGSGIRAPADGAKLYDEDVKKQAQQLGLPGW